jgi:hypothetical protein
MQRRGLFRLNGNIEIPVTFLTANYPLNETSGQAIDQKNGNNLDVYGGVVRNGSDYEFNGTDSYLATQGVSDLGFVYNGDDTSFTIRMSLNWDSFYRGYLVSRRVAPGSGEYQLWFEDGILTLDLIENNNFSSRMTISKDIGSTLSLNTWYRLAVTYDGSKNRSGMKMFINGVRIDDTVSNLSTYNGMTSASNQFRIGAPEFNAGYRFDGHIKDVYIDKGVEFTQSQLNQDYKDSGI